MARPREWDRAALREAFIEYVERTEIPIVADFAYTHGIQKQRIYEWEELADPLKACTAKKEAALEAKALSGDVNCTMAIFSLKQLGWTDRQETTHRGDAAHPIVVSQADGSL